VKIIGNEFKDLGLILMDRGRHLGSNGFGKAGFEF
jgi:hypothetical protein